MQALVCVLLAGVTASQAFADERLSGQDPAPGEEVAEPAGAPVLPPPDFARNKPPIQDVLLKDKREGPYVTGVPTFGWDEETGFNYGAAVNFFDNGSKSSPFFRYTPYRQRVIAGGSNTTGGYTDAYIGYDEPYMNDTPWRLRAAALFRRNEFENYFGVGESTLGPLTYPGSTKEYSNYDDYAGALKQVVDGKTWANYASYSKEEVSGDVSLERDMLGGLLRPQIGLHVGHVTIGDYTGDTYGGGIVQPTHLREDYDAGRITGFTGGWDNALKVGVTFDSRDFEPDPNSGVMLQFAGRVATQWLGSRHGYEQLAFSARGFYSMLSDPERLIGALRVTYGMQFGDVPFYSAPILPSTDYYRSDKTGLGGFETLRGYRLNRFVGGDAVAYANAELRWSFGQISLKVPVLGEQHLRFMLVPFVDSGRVFDHVSDTTTGGWKTTGGAGFRLAWNLATVVAFDYGVSSEGNLFYMEMGRVF